MNTIKKNLQHNNIIEYALHISKKYTNKRANLYNSQSNIKGL